MVAQIYSSHCASELTSLSFYVPTRNKEMDKTFQIYSCHLYTHQKMSAKGRTCANGLRKPINKIRIDFRNGHHIFSRMDLVIRIEFKKRTTQDHFTRHGTLIFWDHSITVLSKLVNQLILKISPIGSYVKSMSVDVGNLGWRTWSTDTILKGDHLRNIPSKFGPNWLSRFRGEDF